MDPFLGEIRLFSGTFAPNGWALCQGQLMQIRAFPALFSLLGTSYGGNGTTTFGLPNLQGSVPLGPGQGPGTSAYQIGQVGGTASVTLNAQQMPAHTHFLNGDNSNVNTDVPAGNMVGKGANRQNFVYANASPLVTMAANVVGNSGSGEPHENRQPFLSLQFIIALQGIFPARP